MSYTPPASTLDAAWWGEGAYRPSVERLVGRWAGGGYLSPNGPDQLAVSSPAVLIVQDAQVSGWDSLATSPQLVSHDTDYIPPYVVTNGYWFGAESYVPPGLPLLAMWRRPEAGGDTLVVVEGLDALDLGSPTLSWTEHLAPSGWGLSEMGEPLATWNQVLQLQGSDQLTVPSADVSRLLNVSWQGSQPYFPVTEELLAGWGDGLPGKIAAYGWDSAKPSSPEKVWNHTQVAGQAGAIPPVNSYGDADVWLYTRYLVPPGIDAQQLGTQWASHWLRYITSPGVGDKTARGTPWVSRSPRHLEPSGLDAMGIYDNHVVGGLRFIEGVGWDSQAFGDRIIPEGQTIYPLGFSGQVGDHDVQLLKRYLAATGFATNHDDLRFGYQYVWNLRQYILQDWDPNDGLNPQPFGQWTQVGLRDKYPVPQGWLSDRYGYQFVWNKAAAVLPPSIPAPENDEFYKAGSVTHWERRLSLEGFDSLVSDRWHNLTNTADLLHPVGYEQLGLAQPTIENRSRLYDYVGGWESEEYGLPFVADAIRQISFRGMDTIEPPQIDLPTVDLYTRYIEEVTVGGLGVGGYPELQIRWTLIEPKWAFHPPAWIGEPALHNVTPELRTGGANHEEFGPLSIRTQWRRVETHEGYMTQFGRLRIADTLQHIEFVGALSPPIIVPGPVVTKIGGLPDAQRIVLQEDEGGIEPALDIRGQVPAPSLNLLFAYPEGFNPSRYGDAVVHANSIRVEPGYWDHLFGEPNVSLKIRRLLVIEWPMDQVFEPPKQRVSPHTIYAVVEAPQQAIANHPFQRLHYVDHDTYGRRLTGPGAPRVTHRHRWLRPNGFSWPPPTSAWPQPGVRNAKAFVGPNGLLSQRFGIPSVPSDRALEQFDSEDSSEFGSPSLEIPYYGPLFANPAGIGALGMGSPGIEFLHRSRDLVGWDSLSMGTRRPGDTPYQWQGLRVGPMVPTMPQGFSAELFGDTWISHYVRGLSVEGFDPFESDYEPGRFAMRMRVRRVAPNPEPPIRLFPTGIEAGQPPLPNFKPLRHYILPDGNAEQYRKGAQNL